ncbi:MAG: glycosyltransferase, partial [Desulfobacterales bacterium]|nr:glycosyltransferase [Desulfobacterales bacterium]
MKKILIVCKGHTNIAGAQLYLKHIASLFPKKDFELCFALWRADGLKFIEEISDICNTVVVEYDWRHLPFLRAFIQGWRLFREKKPELIIFNSPEDQILAPLWAAYLSRVPQKTLVVHWAQSENDMPLFSKKRLNIPIPSPWAIQTRLTRAMAYRLLNALIFVSHGTHRAYVKLYKVPDAKCHTIHNGVPVERFYQPQL